eukprot:6090415-Pleurochrysis_carterae.AAC.1
MNTSAAATTHKVEHFYRPESSSSNTSVPCPRVCTPALDSLLIEINGCNFQALLLANMSCVYNQTRPCARLA